MIRALVTLAAGGAIVSIACLTAAVAIGGPEAAARTAWGWDPDWRWDWAADHAHGPQASRTVAWTGGSTLAVDAPAEIEYVQQPGPATLTISGPARAVEDAQVNGGEISLRHARHHHRSLHIRLTAPAVNRFELRGAGKLSVSQYKQDQLAVAVSGQAEVTAAGQAREVDLSVSGAGDADLSDLKTQRADIMISGAGKAVAGPTDWARVRISGLGDVELTTRPKHLETEISGAGHVRQPDLGESRGDDPDPDLNPDAGPKRPT
jgi:hypothetical protein